MYVLLIFFLSGFSFTRHARFASRGMARTMLTPLYHFHTLHEHLDIGQVITVESSPLLITNH